MNLLRAKLEKSTETRRSGFGAEALEREQINQTNGHIGDLDKCDNLPHPAWRPFSSM
jgi:hypothetical protein